MCKAVPEEFEVEFDVSKLFLYFGDWVLCHELGHNLFVVCSQRVNTDGRLGGDEVRCNLSKTSQYERRPHRSLSVECVSGGVSGCGVREVQYERAGSL
jgi:hypothetical protein